MVISSLECLFEEILRLLLTGFNEFASSINFATIFSKIKIDFTAGFYRERRQS